MRDAVTTTLQNWNGGLLVLHGDLCDELCWYPQLRKAIDNALTRSRAAGGLCEAVEAPDPDHPEIALKLLRAWGATTGAPLRLTGAWFDPTDASGCINSTCEALRLAGFVDVDILDCAAQLSPWESEFDEEDAAVPRASLPRDGR
ncbi:hypothetical protein [Achromobacter anxifer]|uniref:hypothetical protein n=1 Tax=Achromobacter anxifer TaxID=1287737 RepID=UPI0023F65EF9|nr:hypothetical protein [Achromobacter anxifer]MDF8362043.1 hypothetical protein [Achromobacter anxifer]